MSDKQFWKIAYLYATKYNYDVLYYRPEKKDIWFINSYNEITRLLYHENLKLADVDANVYNIINNEERLKKVFKLSSLKVKTLHISGSIENNIQEYKKYKVSDTLSVERILISKKNIRNFIDKRDEKFIDFAVYNERYKKKIEDKYNSKENIKYNINFYFLSLALVFILTFVTNYLYLYFKNVSLYQYIDYNYQKIISGEFYRLLTDVFVFNGISQLIIVVITMIAVSFLLGDSIKLTSAIFTMLLTVVIYNVLLLFKQVSNLEITNVAMLALLGSVFIVEYNKNSNLKFMYSIIIPVAYILVSIISLGINFNIVHYIVSFIFGIIIHLFFYKRVNVIIAYTLLLVCLVCGVLFKYLNIDVKSHINNYHYNSIKDRFNSINENTDASRLEYELTSKNKSVLTYYELGMIKMATSSRVEAKKIFLESLNFDNTFAPIYYELALIEFSENNTDKSKEYINKAIDLDKNNSRYIDFRNELN